MIRQLGGRAYVACDFVMGINWQDEDDDRPSTTYTCNQSAPWRHDGHDYCFGHAPEGAKNSLLVKHNGEPLKGFAWTEPSAEGFHEKNRVTIFGCGCVHKTIVTPSSIKDRQNTRYEYVFCGQYGEVHEQNFVLADRQVQELAREGFDFPSLQSE